jgi:uncharacterized protein involved in exopolysaccharide biosynthesis
VEEEQTIELRELLAMLLTNIKKIASITVICIIFAGIYLLVVSPTYQSETLLRIKQDQGIGSSLLDAMPGGNTSATQQRMSTYAEILKSRSVVEPVIKATEEVNEKGMYPSYDGYIKSVNTLPFKNTEILKLTVNAKSPEKAQLVAAKLVDSFLLRLSDLSRTEKKVTKNFVEERMLAAKKEMLENEDKLLKYKEKVHIITPDAQVAALGQRVELVDTQIAKTKLEIATSKATVEALNKQLGDNKNAVASSAITDSFSKQLSDLELQKIEGLTKYTEKHPLMKRLDEKIAATKEQLQLEYDKIAAMKAPAANPIYQQMLGSKLQNAANIQIAKAKLTALDKLAKENDKKIEKLSKVEQGYLQVSRNAKVSQEIYIMLAKRLEEAKVAEVMVPNDVQVIDTPTLATAPIKPRKALTLVLAAILGLVISCGYVVINELMHRKIRTQEDIENYLGIPVLGVIPNEDSLEKAKKKKNKKGILNKLGGLF